MDILDDLASFLVNHPKKNLFILAFATIGIIELFLGGMDTVLGGLLLMLAYQLWKRKEYP